MVTSACDLAPKLIRTGMAVGVALGDAEVDGDGVAEGVGLLEADALGVLLGVGEADRVLLGVGVLVALVLGVGVAVGVLLGTGVGLAVSLYCHSILLDVLATPPCSGSILVLALK